MRWRRGRARAEAEGVPEKVDAIARFFPAEWLPNLPGACAWTQFFGGSSSPLSNPAAAVLTQSKRFPLVWDELRTRLPTWARMLPETRDPRQAPWQTDDAWVLKPALGRVGEGIGVRGVVPASEWRTIEREAKRSPHDWVAQRRFVPTPVFSRGTALYPGVGVYAVDGCVAGAYGRLARRPLIDAKAMDAAVLIAPHGSNVRGESAAVRGLSLGRDASPAFLLDSERMSPTVLPQAGKFDNRWLVFPQDFPSGNRLQASGIREALLLHAERGLQEDVAHVLLRWQQAGIRITAADWREGERIRDLQVQPPSMFRRA